MDLHDTCASRFVRVRKFNFSVDTPASQQSGVKNVHAICRGNHLDAVVAAEAVELIQQLKHSALDFAISTQLRVKAFRAHSVQLIDEYYSRRFLLRELECVAHKLRAVADKHLHELRPCQLQKCRIGLSRASSRQKRFTDPGRPVHEHALRRFYSNVLETLGVRHRQNNGFDELLNLFVQPTDVPVVFSRLFVHLHCLNPGVVLWR
mmetsp:Transcript_1439/g.3863  ORF Transcript_1439/g.3863 Transcript_1439/m.3863 type:complete len:206 (+) Transcript_1439:591-1208(+)